MSLNIVIGGVKGSEIPLTQQEEPNPLKRPNQTCKRLISGKVLQICDLARIIDGI
jgi:hypothetical protein